MHYVVQENKQSIYEISSVCGLLIATISHLMGQLQLAICLQAILWVASSLEYMGYHVIIHVTMGWYYQCGANMHDIHAHACMHVYNCLPVPVTPN